jgi:hypothetical protein
MDTHALAGAGCSGARAAAILLTIPQTVLVQIIGRIYVAFDSIVVLAQVSVVEAKE